MRILPITTTILAAFCVVNATPQNYGTGTGATGAKVPTASPTTVSATPKSYGTRTGTTGTIGTGVPSTSPTPQTTADTPSPAAPDTFANNYPTKDKVPDVNSPQVQAWLKELDLSKVPNLPVSNGGVPNPLEAVCDPPTVIVPDQGSWTCQKFTADDDIQSCPDVGTWGLTYDDGPSDSTPKLLSKLDEHKLKATFFVIGSRVVQNPQILKAAYDAGHNIAVHTWSHPALTSLSNEAVVSELKWTMKIIKDVIGVTPEYMRPPYGDTDNRVRAITRALGLKTVLWVPEFDTNDWTLSADPPKSVDYVLNIFETWMQKFPTMNTGFIVLEHDLHPEGVNAATMILDRAVKVPNLKIMTVPQCVGDNKPYLELNNSTTVGSNTTATPNSSIITIPFTLGTVIAVLFSLLLNLN